MTTKDLAVTSYTSWSKRSKREGQLSTDLLRGEEGTKVATFGDSPAKTFESTATVENADWKIHFAIGGEASATLPDGRVFTADPGDKGFSKSKSIEIDMAGLKMLALNENKNNWIIDDADSQKVAQFTGVNNGVRRSILEFEDGVALPLDQEVFLSWVARKTLESRLVGSSWGLTLFLIILTPIIIYLTFN
ncbi:hypothetical protein [Corynebacterium pacaense]|uniref:hypothetical protein n=1 Tax=Corynebacterium pacaense TaxID=1816684 RepID=UPI0009BBFB94|nr:hypothetical protein [Corynebacterium pacaense]